MAISILNPKKPDMEFQDDLTKEIILKTIDFFEGKGLKKMKDDYHNRVWYEDFFKFQKREEIFYNLLTPPEYGDENCR
jgi:acyl-CoA dehydrogenase